MDVLLQFADFGVGWSEAAALAFHGTPQEDEGTGGVSVSLAQGAEVVLAAGDLVVVRPAERDPLPEQSME